MSERLADDLLEASIRTQATATDWRAAITLAGDALVAGGVTSPAYTAEMIAAVDALGPYIVIAPGLAIAHSRPSPAVHRVGLSWISLATPVAFGSTANDPVSLVIGLAAPDTTSHLGIMSDLANLLLDAEALAALKAAHSPSEVRRLLAQFDPSTTPDPFLEKKAHS
jgi:PTS system ascorbate-specific IIA component